MLVLALEGQQLKLEIWFALLLRLLDGCLVASDLRLLEKLLFKLIVTHFEVGNQPVNNVLESDISYHTLKGLPTKIDFTGGTFCPLLVLSKEGVNAPLAVGAHTFVDGMSVAVNSFAEEAGKVLEHVSFCRSPLCERGYVGNVGKILHLN